MIAQPTLSPGYKLSAGNSPGAGIDIFGDGEVILSGKNTYLGETHIRKGTLTIAGSIAGSVYVEPFGILNGHGIIGGHATIQGAAMGVLQVDSALLESQATLKIDLRANKPSKLVAVGDRGIVIDSDVCRYVIPETNGATFGKQYHILHSEKGIITGSNGLIIQSADPAFEYFIDPQSTDRDLFIRTR